MLGAEKTILLAIEEHLTNILLPFERFYNKKEKLYFFSMRQPLGDKESVRLLIVVYPNQRRRIELRCMFSIQLWPYFNRNHDLYAYLNHLNALNHFGKYGVDRKGYLFSGYTFFHDAEVFSPVRLMSCLLDLFEEGEKIYGRLERRKEITV